MQEKEIVLPLFGGISDLRSDTGRGEFLWVFHVSPVV